MSALSPPQLTITAEEYRQRRQRFLAQLGQGTAILRSAPQAVMHNDVEYTFRQDSNFYYLTGFNEPNAVAVLTTQHTDHQFILFVQPKDRTQEVWTGYRVGPEAAVTQFGADVAYPISELDSQLPQYCEKAERLYYHLGLDEPFNERVLKLWRRLLAQYPRRGTGPLALEDPNPILARLRLTKSPAELALLRRAADIAAQAHNQARQVARPGVYEYQVQAEMEATFRREGAMGPAYPSIMAAGPNACILHYTENSRCLAPDDLLLIDAGCAVDYYNSDITRTFPAAGRFTPPQQAIYETVLAAQEAAIAAVRPGVTLVDIHTTALRVLVCGLVDLGLLVGHVDDLVGETEEAKQAYRPFFMHRTSHWLGLDVHDVGPYRTSDGEPVALEPGYVFTVEPGLYIGPDTEPREGQPAIADHWRGIGVRIEDDVLVTETGCEVLTAAVPKSVAAMER